MREREGEREIKGKEGRSRDGERERRKVGKAEEANTERQFFMGT